MSQKDKNLKKKSRSDNKDRFEVYGKMIKKFVCRSSPSHVSENPKEYIMVSIDNLETSTLKLCEILRKDPLP